MCAPASLHPVHGLTVLLKLGWHLVTKTLLLEAALWLRQCLALGGMCHASTAGRHHLEQTALMMSAVSEQPRRCAW